MPLLIATLCDTAIGHYGKVNVLGVSNAIGALSFGAGFSFTFVLRFCLEIEKHRNHRFSITLVDESPGPSNQAVRET